MCLYTTLKPSEDENNNKEETEENLAVMKEKVVTKENDVQDTETGKVFVGLSYLIYSTI
jgi:hypothetical protein